METLTGRVYGGGRLSDDSQHQGVRRIRASREEQRAVEAVQLATVPQLKAAERAVEGEGEAELVPRQTSLAFRLPSRTHEEELPGQRNDHAKGRSALRPPQPVSRAED